MTLQWGNYLVISSISLLILVWIIGALTMPSFPSLTKVSVPSAVARRCRPGVFYCLQLFILIWGDFIALLLVLTAHILSRLGLAPIIMANM